jgi:glycosyltransferase involved in cell wall biosynthesis
VTTEGPRISVVIPTYRPDPLLLRQALLSVLEQDLGAEHMDIEVVDDASPDNRPDQVVREVGAGRVGLYRHPSNLGLARNWNACIDRARGPWVHILHQDDRIEPGFYDALRAALDRPDVVIAYCRHAYIDSEGKVIGLSYLERETPGVVDDFLRRIASEQRFQFASALLRRVACLEAGGFNASLVFALDWEMWARLASRGKVWFEPRLLACFRIHDKSTGWGMAMNGVAVRDHLRAIALINSYVPAESRQELWRASLQGVAHWAFHTATRLVEHGAVREGLGLGLECFWRLRTGPRFIAKRRLLRLFGRALSEIANERLHGRPKA